MIIKIKPALKNYIWGGTNLITKWNKTTNEAKLAESWELSLNDSGTCRVCGGEYDGQPLHCVLTDEDFGSNCIGFPFFPVLVKLIDAATPLSLQVHPNDDYALQFEGKYGKTEMWHILDATEDAYIYLGFKRKVTKQQFVEALNNKTLLNLLNKVNVKPNQTYLVPSGTIHAIGAGVTLIEIQQNSDLTYRIYDYDRLDSDGKQRELHIDKSLKVLNFDKYTVSNPNRDNLLGKCKYFSAYRYQGSRTIHYANSFVSVTAFDNEITVGDIKMQRGDTVFVSAGTPAQIIGNGCYCLVTVEK